MKKKWRLLGLIGTIVIVILGLGIFGFVHQKKSAPSQINLADVKYQDFHLEIPKLNISTPIIPDVPGDSKDTYFKALEGGVAHFAGTKKPGEGGLIFIFGHSSFYPWAAGNYKEIFRDLEDIEVNDEILVWYNKREYKYKVVETKVVSPNDTSVLNPTDFEQLTLMTCVPPGTTQKRLIVNAKPTE